MNKRNRLRKASIKKQKCSGHSAAPTVTRNSSALNEASDTSMTTSLDQAQTATNESSHLTEHERTHTGEKPYSCSECDGKFVQETDLEEHNKVHTGDKQFSCSQCDKSFAQKLDLTEHERTHIGEKPYSCSQCDEKFAQDSELDEHERIHNDQVHSIAQSVTRDSDSDNNETDQCKICHQKQANLAEKYRVTRNEVTSRIRSEDLESVIQALIKSESPSEYWKTVREITSCSDCGQILMLKENGEIISDPKRVP